MPCVFAGAISKQNMKYSLKSCTMPFEESAVCISRCLTLLSKELPLLEKSIFLHTICSIIDIEHPFQKCNMFETVRTIKECSFASYHWTTEYLSCMAKNIPVKKQHSWKTGLIVLRFKDAHSSNYNIFQEESCPTPKDVIPKIWFVVLEKYHIMHSEKW